MVGVSGGAAFLLCPQGLSAQFAFSAVGVAGGRLDPGETAVDAALRETTEEVGAELARRAMCSAPRRLPDPWSGYVITPVVIWGGGRLTLQPAPDEVVAVYRVGLHQLQRDDSPRFITIPESLRPVVQIPLGNDLIHAAGGRAVAAALAGPGGAGPIRSMNSNSRCSPGDDQRGRGSAAETILERGREHLPELRGSAHRCRRGNGSAVTRCPTARGIGGAVIRRPPDLDAAVDDEVIVPAICRLHALGRRPVLESRCHTVDPQVLGPHGWFPHRGSGRGIRVRCVAMRRAGIGTEGPRGVDDGPIGPAT